MVPGHADGLGDRGLGGEEPGLESVRHDQVPHRLLGVERMLHPADRLALRAPLAAGQIVRDVGRRLVVGEWRQAGLDAAPTVVDRSLVHRPADAPLEEVVETRVLPGSSVVAVGGVEDAALSPASGPRSTAPRSALPAGPARLTAFLVVLVVHVSLIPGAERLETLHDRVRGVNDIGLEFARPVAEELGADQRDIAGRIEEAVGRAVDRHERTAPLDVRDERLLLRRGDLVDIRVDQECIVFGERLGIEVVYPLGVGDANAPSGEDRSDLRGPSAGT